MSNIWDTLPYYLDLCEIVNADPDWDLEWCLGKTLVPSADISVAEAFVMAGLCESKGEMRRMLKQGGTLRVSGVTVTDMKAPLSAFPDSRDRWVLQRGQGNARCVVAPYVTCDDDGHDWTFAETRADGATKWTCTRCDAWQRRGPA
jgi:hypothetical protein